MRYAASRMRTAGTVLWILAIPACTDDPERTDASPGGGGGIDPGPEATDHGTEGDAGDDGAGDRLDVASPDLPPEEGCQKVDFLFVIDNSISMERHQAALISSFPGFIDTIQQTLSATSDYHVMVVDTDAEGKCSAEKCAAGTANAELCHGPGSVICTASFTECDTTMGAGVVFPAGQGASNHACPMFGGNRYMIEGEPDLAGTFGCAALVGLAGNGTEQPMDALVAATSPVLNDVGGCNEGFLRDDAILVVTFVTNDPKYVDTGTPQDWYDALVTAKNDDPNAIVVLGLIPDPAEGCKNGGDHWREFVGLFGDRGLVEQVCAEDYTPFFSQAVSLIDTTCDAFDPPG